MLLILSRIQFIKNIQISLITSINDDRIYQFWKTIGTAKLYFASRYG